jgi:hypothetical protein
MRAYLDSILELIGEESLTDEEFESISIDNADDQMAVYEALLSVLESRGSSEVSVFRLQCFFIAQGVNVVGSTPGPVSNIFLGSSLE